MECQMCGCKTKINQDGLCEDCETQSKHDNVCIELLKEKGHTHHCACRQVWGDGECECGNSAPEELTDDELLKTRYFCKWCKKHLVLNGGVFIHDDVFHPENYIYEDGHTLQ